MTLLLEFDEGKVVDLVSCSASCFSDEKGVFEDVGGSGEIDLSSREMQPVRTLEQNVRLSSLWESGMVLDDSGVVVG